MPSRVVTIADEPALHKLAADVARSLSPGDRVGLEGDLGAGKTTFARALIRTLAGDPALEVPSPTFTIVQDYDVAPPLRHVDLYRVGEGELDELGLGDGRMELVEWPREAMDITVAIAMGHDPHAREVTISAPADFLGRLERQARLDAFLAEAGWGRATRAPLKLDASTRRYERLSRAGANAVLMDAPAFRPAAGAYAAHARLADGNPDAFLAVGALLREAGLSAPAILAADRAAGFLLLEDFGDEKIAGEAPHAERYLVAAEALAAFHERTEAPGLIGPPAHEPPRFDADLAAVEVAVFTEWALGRGPDDAFIALWRAAIEALPRTDDRLALRDVHSPNLLWLSDREGIKRIGWIDYQDAMIAPSAYDVVSLAQDARVTVPGALEAEVVARYLAARANLDEGAFRQAYHVLGAQRATRILGVFRRLNDRDGKPQYLAHIPRVRRALARHLDAEPALAPLKAWYAAHTDVLTP